AAPGQHQDPERIADLLHASPDPLVSQFRATYTTLLNLLDAYGSFATVREIAARSFAHRHVAHQISRIEEQIRQNELQIKTALEQSGCDVDSSLVLGLERLVSARARLVERTPQTRAELLMSWLDDVVRVGRIVGIGRSGKRLVVVTHRYNGNVGGLRE